MILAELKFKSFCYMVVVKYTFATEVDFKNFCHIRETQFAATELSKFAGSKSELNWHKKWGAQNKLNLPKANTNQWFIQILVKPNFGVENIPAKRVLKVAKITHLRVQKPN